MYLCRMNIRQRLLLILIGCLAGCVPPPEFEPADAGCLRSAYQGLFVLNEGAWTSNQASLDFYPSGDSLGHCAAVFQQVNGQPLGDVANHVVIDEDTLYIVVNNSRLIYKLQLPSLHLLGQLSLPASASPREMAITSPHKAYVTSFFTNHLFLFNPATMELLPDSIIVENTMEGISIAQDKAFVACGNYLPPEVNNKLAVIDTQTDELLQYIELPVENPGKVLTYQGKVLVACRGDYDPQGEGSAIVEVDPEGKTVTRVTKFEGSLFEMEIVEDALWVLRDSSVARIDLVTWEVEANFLQEKTLVASEAYYFYGIHYAPDQSALYIAMAHPTRNGQLLVLNPFGQIQQRLETGMFPGEVFFYN